jgi:hypothetical protein
VSEACAKGAPLRDLDDDARRPARRGEGELFNLRFQHVTGTRQPPRSAQAQGDRPLNTELRQREIERAEERRSLNG